MANLKPILVLVAALVFGIAPFVTPPFSGYDPAMFPVRIERPFIQPASYAFGIWSVIYLWLVAHAVFGLWARSTNQAWDRVRWPLALSLIIGAIWLAIAGVAPIWATLLIWVMAVAAILAFVLSDPATDRWMLSGPTAILAGWLTAAAAVSLGAVLGGYGWLSNTAAAGAMLALVLAIAIPVQLRRPQMPVYALTVIWALGGIIAVNLADARLVAVAAALGIAAMAATLLIGLRRAVPRPV